MKRGEKEEKKEGKGEWIHKNAKFHISPLYNLIFYPNQAVLVYQLMKKKRNKNKKEKKKRTNEKIKI